MSYTDPNSHKRTCCKIFHVSAGSLFYDKPIYFHPLEPVWDVDSLDWKGLSAPEITKRVTEKVQPGSIVLFHNAAKHTPEALPCILEKLLQDGYTFLPISQILLDGEYTIDHAGRQCPAN